MSYNVILDVLLFINLSNFMGSISITINSNESWEEWLPRNFTTVQVADRELASKITNRQMADEIHILF